MDVGAAIRSDAFFDDEGDEWEPLTRSVCRRLAARGISVPGEKVRRFVRKIGMPTRKVNGRLMARESDIAKLSAALIRYFEGKVQ